MLPIIIKASLSSLFFGLFGVSWDAVDRKIDREFPQVDFISAEELLVESDVQLFDVREGDEYEVSHLQGAANVTTGAEIATLVADKSTEIVVYCSVGYRSARVAEELSQLGFTNVRNLRHSIFEWAEKGYPMIDSQGDADKIHPFNRAWGALIDPSLHQYPQ